tara:strand:+ start:9655 stop:10761 length:1107 start_codon:yes stop_codon:yes gene_type:complete
MLKKCRACNSIDLFLSQVINNIPLNIWPQKNIKQNNYKKIEIYICKTCGQIQIQKLQNILLNKIYTGNTYNFDNKNQIIYRLKSLKKVYNFKNKKLLDIGGGTNPFLKYVDEGKKWISDFKINNNLKNNNTKFIKGDFLNKKININFDFVFLFHTLEHFENTSFYLKKIHRLLNKEGRLIIEVPNANYDLKKNPYYIFFHMHITIYKYENLINFLSLMGFKKDKVFSKKEVLFLSFKKTNLKEKSNYKKLFLSSKKFIKNVFSSISYIDKFFFKNNSNNIAIFGAGGSTNLFLANSKILKNKIKYIIDSDKKKENLYLFNNKIRIKKISTHILDNIENLIILNESHIAHIPKKYRKKIINIVDIINGK